MAPGIYILHFYLEGNYVQVKNGSNNVPYDQKVVALGSGTNVINHTWSANDRSNVRQHAQVMHDYFTSSPFNLSSMNYQMEAHVDESLLPRSKASSDGTNIYFGDYGGEPWEETAEVIRHEYTHAAIDKVYGGEIGDDSEGGAMDEGFSDYFSSTISGDPLQGETVLPTGRNLDNKVL